MLRILHLPAAHGTLEYMTAELAPIQLNNTHSPEAQPPPRLQLLNSDKTTVENTGNDYRDTLLEQIAHLQGELEVIEAEFARRINTPKFQGQEDASGLVPRRSTDEYQLPFIKRQRILAEIDKLQRVLEKQSGPDTIPVELKIGARVARHVAAPQV